MLAAKKEGLKSKNVTRESVTLTQASKNYGIKDMIKTAMEQSKILTKEASSLGMSDPETITLDDEVNGINVTPGNNTAPGPSGSYTDNQDATNPAHAPNDIAPTLSPQSGSAPQVQDFDPNNTIYDTVIDFDAIDNEMNQVDIDTDLARKAARFKSISQSLPVFLIRDCLKLLTAMRLSSENLLSTLLQRRCPLSLLNLIRFTVTFANNSEM